jgi:hypothetical protein
MTGERLNSANDAGRPLARYDAARRALAEAHRVDEVKSIRDKAIAMQAYARQAKDTTLLTQATEIRMRAERRAGELLIEMAERKERLASKDTLARGRSVPPREVSTLSDLGVTKTQSSRWQRLARIEPDKFERNVTRASTDAYNRMTGRFLKEAEIERAKRQHAELIEHGCTVDDLVALAKTGKRFPVIYADPGWPWETWGRLGKIRSCCDNHYTTNAIDEIKALPVLPLAADDCALFIWGTWPWLPQVIDVIASWGFTYKTDAFCLGEAEPQRRRALHWDGVLYPVELGVLPARDQGIITRAPSLRCSSNNFCPRRRAQREA